MLKWFDIMWEVSVGRIDYNGVFYGVSLRNLYNVSVELVDATSSSICRVNKIVKKTTTKLI